MDPPSKLRLEKLPANTLVLSPISPPAPVQKLMDGDEFDEMISTPDRAMIFAQECGLLPTSTVCPECGTTVKKTKNNGQGSESRIFSCENGHPRVRISNDSIAVLQADCAIAKEAAMMWRRLCRHVYCIALQKREIKIGGPGKTVEVDEAHMIRSKGRREKGRTGYWMVGGCEVGNPSAYFVEMVASRDRATLEEVGPDGATTNHIDARWKHVRASLPKNGVQRWFHVGYIQAEQLQKMPWTFQDFLRECGSVTKDQLDLLMSCEDEEKQATIKLLTVDNDRRKKNAELIQKSDKVIRSHHNRKLKVIQKQQSLASIQLDIVKAKLAKKATPKVVQEDQPQLDEE
ncbi:hypothetical protein BLNAU_17055 [Blattamonas nauphoetae]|uniref:Uncharacterized protein n=1 Tax=Blattamonas nauphoetae TaxID=2049346 RepID=A0ABQ9X8K8_9EUKA|nr:hypothetical protein BLNAU_17055 [Blattamonas nauphoetae]